MTRSRLHVARDADVTIVSRTRLRLPGGRPVRRSWTALTETTTAAMQPGEHRSLPGAALVIVPPVALGALIGFLGSVESGVLAAGGVFFGMSYLTPVLRRRAAGRAKVDPATAVVLTDAAERVAFADAVATADRITATWPRLGALIDAADGEGLLAEALWEIAAVQARRQELTGVLDRLSRPDFAARSPDDETAHRVDAHVRATKAALTALEVDLARRVASLRRAEEAGRAFIREQEMRSAIRAAQETLRSTRGPEPTAPGPGPTTAGAVPGALDPGAADADAPHAGGADAGGADAGGADAGALDAGAVHADASGRGTSDPGAELAEHTRSVLDAYRELTDGLHPDPPA